MSATHLAGPWRGGWHLAMDWDAARGDWARTATRGQLRIVQGERTHEAFLNALDRIDGRKVLADYIDGLQAGLSQEEASQPLPFGPDGEPLIVTELAPEPDPVEEGDPETLVPGPMGIGTVALVDVWWVRHMRADLNDPEDIRSRQNELARVELLNYLAARHPQPESPWGSQIPPQHQATWAGMWSIYDAARLQDLETLQDQLAPYPAVYAWFHRSWSEGAKTQAAEAGPAGMATARALLGIQDPVPAPAPRWVQQSLFDLMEAM